VWGGPHVHAHQQVQAPKVEQQVQARTSMQATTRKQRHAKYVGKHPDARSRERERERVAGSRKQRASSMRSTRAACGAGVGVRSGASVRTFGC
jgi:hypothetical protein